MLRIERSLKKSAEHLFDKYRVLKHRLLTINYGFWGQSFEGGNDHGPQHIERVLEHLDSLLGPGPVSARTLNAYELYLAMMAILYHDLGNLRARKGHADISKLFLEEEHNDYIFDVHDRAIIAAAVVSHGSSKDIGQETKAFVERERVGRYSVRPRVIAALVRLADELDEDYRRADPDVARQLNIPESSKFYWEFCQRISGIEAHHSDRHITYHVQFREEDAGRLSLIDDAYRPFVTAFAEKLAKTNGERVKVNQYLPDTLRYYQIDVVLKPLPGSETWKETRTFVFTDRTTAAEFVAFCPELFLDPAAGWIEELLASVRSDDFEKMDADLRRLEQVGAELSTAQRLKVAYVRACVESLRAARLPAGDAERDAALERSLEALRQWMRLGTEGAFKKTSNDAYNCVHNMSEDKDLRCVLKERADAVLKIIPEHLHKALSAELFPQIPRGGGGGGGSGCVPAGTTVQTPSGGVPIEQLREGDEIISVDLESKTGAITTRVVATHAGRAPSCIRLNGAYVFTPTHPLYESRRGWTPVARLTTGMSILDEEMRPVEITHVEHVNGGFDVHTLTTDHPSHNYLAYGLICGNKHPGHRERDFGD